MRISNRKQQFIYIGSVIYKRRYFVKTVLWDYSDATETDNATRSLVNVKTTECWRLRPLGQFFPYPTGTVHLPE